MTAYEYVCENGHPMWSDKPESRCWHYLPGGRECDGMLRQVAGPGVRRKGERVPAEGAA